MSILPPQYTSDSPSHGNYHGSTRLALSTVRKYVATRPHSHSFCRMTYLCWMHLSVALWRIRDMLHHQVSFLSKFWVVWNYSSSTSVYAIVIATWLQPCATQLGTTDHELAWQAQICRTCAKRFCRIVVASRWTEIRQNRVSPKLRPVRHAPGRVLDSTKTPWGGYPHHPLAIPSSSCFPLFSRLICHSTSIPVSYLVCWDFNQQS